MGLGGVEKKGHVAATNLRLARSVYGIYKTSKKLRKEEEELKKQLPGGNEKERMAEAKKLRDAGKITAEEYAQIVETDKSYQLQQQKEQQERIEELERSQSKAMFGSMIETFFNMSIIDIENTLRKVCRKVTKDASVSPEDRLKRARGMEIIGKIYQKYGAPPDQGLASLKSKIDQQVA